jgi:hypothetical protein
MEIMRRLQMKMTGGSHNHLKIRMKRIGIDIADIAKRGRAWSRGKILLNARVTAESILVLRNDGYRQPLPGLKGCPLMPRESICFKASPPT